MSSFLTRDQIVGGSKVSLALLNYGILKDSKTVETCLTLLLEMAIGGFRNEEVRMALQKPITNFKTRDEAEGSFVAGLLKKVLSVILTIPNDTEEKLIKCILARLDREADIQEALLWLLNLCVTEPSMFRLGLISYVIKTKPQITG